MSTIDSPEIVAAFLRAVMRVGREEGAAHVHFRHGELEVSVQLGPSAREAGTTVKRTEKEQDAFDARMAAAARKARLKSVLGREPTDEELREL